jgi:hypothetical protein
MADSISRQRLSLEHDFRKTTVQLGRQLGTSVSSHCRN